MLSMLGQSSVELGSLSMGFNGGGFENGAKLDLGKSGKEMTQRFIIKITNFILTSNLKIHNI